MNRRKVVVGIDGSDSAEHALSWALAAADGMHADVELVAAWQRPMVIDAAGLAAPYVADEELEHAARDTIDVALRRFGAAVDPLRTAGHHISGRIEMGPASEVLETASKDADLIVVGRRGHHRLARMLGSTSRHVADHAACPVVVVPEA